MPLLLREWYSIKWEAEAQAHRRAAGGKGGGGDHDDEEEDDEEGKPVGIGAGRM